MQGCDANDARFCGCGRGRCAIDDEADGLTCHANPFWSVRGVVEGWVAVADSAFAPWTSGSFFWFPEVR